MTDSARGPAIIARSRCSGKSATGPVGQGSTGAVFRADDVLANIPVAVRILTPALAQHAQLPRIHARIDRNKEITRLRPGALVNLIDITDAGMTLDGEIFVVTDFIDGDHLASLYRGQVQATTNSIHHQGI